MSATAARWPGWPTTTSSRCRPGSTRWAVPLPQRPLAPELLGLVQHVAAYERLAGTGGPLGRPERSAAGAAQQPAGARVAARRRLLDDLLPVDATSGRSTGARGGARDSGRTVSSCWPWTAATSRPTWRSSPPTVGCCRWRGGRAARRTTSVLRDAPSCSQALLRRGARAPGRPAPERRGRAGDRPDHGRRRRPPGGARGAARQRSRRLAGAGWTSTTTRSRCCARAPTAAGVLPWCAAGASTASASRRTAATPASPRSARSAATGAAATTSGLRR